MGLRDWFAGQALAGMAAGVARRDAADLAYRCYLFADAMIAERAKERSE